MLTFRDAAKIVGESLEVFANKSNVESSEYTSCSSEGTALFKAIFTPTCQVAVFIHTGINKDEVFIEYRVKKETARSVYYSIVLSESSGETLASICNEGLESVAEFLSLDF